ncbi:MAG: ATP-dependent helicase/nuclease subunit [Bacillota bacterium]|jgi:ATP-dependent helicase/nuclease subunit B|nr:ATP-dependent helicase/nuclease subunit [Bacillota bacterium]MDK2883160.1 ATP-dependent helicase/nuclease subunit [Bacillota bacterium]
MNGSPRKESLKVAKGAVFRFILGRAGTGKTYTCLKAIEDLLLRKGEEGPPLILLVPEQAAFQMEYALLTEGRVQATQRAEVLSFRRLARRVLAEVGGVARPWLGELGKRMVLRSLIQKHRDELVLLGHSASTPGFTERLAQALAELKLYCISPEMMSAYLTQLTARGEGQGPLAGKLHDLALLYRELEAFLKPRYTDPEGYLSYLAERLPEAASLRGARVWVDGFTGFTPEEYQVLAALLGVAARVEVTLCLDAAELNRPPAETDLFYPTRETYDKLLEVARAREAQVLPPLILDDPASLPPRFARSPELAHVERYFFRYPTRTWVGAVPGLKVVAAANRRAEVEAAAREMLHLAREEGLRWREMALVVRDLELYHELISTVFADYGIPCFIDRKRPVLHHPVAQLALAAFELVTGNWSYEAVFRCLKTDLFPFTREEVDRLENYVLAFGVRGQTWLKAEPWDFHLKSPEGKKRAAFWGDVDSLRRKVASYFTPLWQECLRGSTTGASLTTALWRFLDGLKVGQTLEKWAEAAREQGDLTAFQEHGQVWARFLGLLDELVLGLGETPLTPAEYAEILGSGLESLRLGLVPPSLDQVLVGGLERSRHPNVRAAFVLGVNDGVLPGRAGEDAIFTDREREELAGAGLELAPTSRRRQFSEKYLTYIALTRGSERLWVSFPLADEEGRALVPSRVLTRLRELFPGVPETYAAAGPTGDTAEDLKFLTSPEQAAAHLAAQLRLVRAGQPLGDVWRAVYQYLLSTPETREVAERALGGLKHRGKVGPLPAAVARRLYGSPIRTSVTRLEEFASCPFGHFAVHGLKLERRAEFGLDLPSLGLFTHGILRAVTERLLAEGRDFSALDAGEAAVLVKEEVEKAAPAFAGGVLLSSPRYAYLTRRLTRFVSGAVAVLAEQARKGEFRTRAAELKFGLPGGFPGLTFNLPDGTELTLVGQIDRLDVATGADGRTYVRILDYKSSKRTLSLPEVYHGLSLQLLVYLLAVLAGSSALGLADPVPAGIFYFTLGERFLRTSRPLTPEEAVKEFLKEFRLGGLVRGEEAAVILLDRDAACGRPSVISAAINKDGTLRRISGTIAAENFDLLLRFIGEKVKELGTAALAGEVEAAPVKAGGEAACRYCSLHAVCGFDPLLPENSYRILPKLAEEEIWRRVADFVGGRVRKHEEA